MKSSEDELVKKIQELTEKYDKAVGVISEMVVLLKEDMTITAGVRGDLFLKEINVTWYDNDEGK